MMRLPKLRELREAVTAAFSPKFTTKFPAEPCVVPPRYRGKPEFDTDKCIGCGACVNVCPTRALTMSDDTQAAPAVRKITLRYDACIFCGNCAENCTTENGIKLSNKWDLATLNRENTTETFDHSLQICEKCGAVVGSKKHLVWLYEKLGPLAYTNPSLLIAKSDSVGQPQQADSTRKPEDFRTGDFMRILCPRCKYQLNIRM